MEADVNASSTMLLMFVSLVGGVDHSRTARLLETPLVQQAGPCLTNADTAAGIIQRVATDLSGDSTTLAQQGLPYRPTSLALVTDSIVCRAIVNAYNALDTNTATRIDRAYVIQAGTNVYAMVGAKNRSVHVYWDAAYHWLAAFGSMR